MSYIWSIVYWVFNCGVYIKREIATKFSTKTFLNEFTGLVLKLKIINKINYFFWFIKCLFRYKFNVY